MSRLGVPMWHMQPVENRSPAPRRPSTPSRLIPGGIQPSSTPRKIANHLALVAGEVTPAASFQAPQPSPAHNWSPSRSYSPYGLPSTTTPLRPASRSNNSRPASPGAIYSRPASPGAISVVSESLRSRAGAIVSDEVLMRELADASTGRTERGSPLRIDDAIVASTRARDECDRVMSEVFAGIERSFAPNDDKRLVTRAYVNQIGRTANRLREATVRLEREAADLCRIAASEKSDLMARMHHQRNQADGQSRALAGELERSEAERAMHGALAKALGAHPRPHRRRV